MWKRINKYSIYWYYEANEKGWIVVDMKNDWKIIYPFELNK